MSRIDLNTLPLYYQNYVRPIMDLDMLESLRSVGEKTQSLLKSIPEEKGEYRYAPEKWSLKESLCHVMDVERIFAYRALRFARNDQTPLPSYDDNDYAPEANAHARTIKQLAEEMNHLRNTTLDLFKSFTVVMLKREGTAGNNKLSVLSLGYIIAGHELHHHKILIERYLNK
jgi:uncharacterized damage-inducible protein DinB